MYDVAKQFFLKKRLDRTRDRNAVLILLGFRSRKLAVLGDEGINEQVPDDFWDSIITEMTSRFREDDYIGGLEAGILEIGNKLQHFFPYRDDDVNELSNEIHIEE